jgi:PAS domain S-box-containing protein
MSTYALECIRAGTEFVVYRGHRDANPGQVLVVAPASEPAAQKILRRLEHEYGLRDKLDPAWATQPLELVCENGRTMLVLGDPGGQPLDGFLEGPLDLRQFLRISTALANAVGKLHQRGIIHRDLKPANVMVDMNSGNVWLTGLGMASDLPRERQAPAAPETIAGTLAYMAPEQTGRMNRSIDTRSDFYALGVTLYEMLTGVLPFAASDPLDWVHCHIARQPIPPADRRSDVPGPLSVIVMKLLAKMPEDRYQTAGGLEADLTRCLEDWDSLGRINPFGVGAHDASDRLLIPEKLYGRDRESKALIEAFDRVITRGTPEVVLLSGYSGIGKSSIVNELHKAIVVARGIIVSGKFDQYKRDVPFATLSQAFRMLARQILSKNEMEVGRWREAIRDAVGLNGQLLINLVSELELIIGKQAPVPELPPHEAENQFHAAFRAFLGVVARKEHPLALFLDDLQWLDTATLKLLEHLVIHPDVEHLLLIGAYRDNEVGPSDPLMVTLNAIRKTKAEVRDVVLGPLSVDDVGQLVADSLHENRTRSDPLAHLVHEKTAGNPFFVIQFLTTLAEERLLKFDMGEATWRWDMDRIRRRPSTENVVDLVVGKLNRLPDPTQEAIKQLACLGNSVETAALKMIQEGSEEEMHANLRGALREGFIIRLGSSYRFVHDRVQEAAYSLIPNKMRAEVHLQIGRLLLARMSADELPENIFDIVNQLNQGRALLADPKEKQRVAELNLLAGRKAKASAGYAGACTYLSVGMELLGREGWETQYEVSFDLWTERAECEFLCGNFDEAQGLISGLIERAALKTEKAAAYRLQIDLHVMRMEVPSAVSSSLECLHLFGIDISTTPTWEQVQAEYKKVWHNLNERSIESLVELPLMTDPKMQAAMRVLSGLYSPAFLTDTNLFYLCLCHMVNLSLVYGTTGASAHSYSQFGFLLGPAFHRYIDGYRFAKLGVDLVDRHAFAGYKAKVYLATAQFAIWTRPVTVAIDFVRAAFLAAVETGDLVCGSACCAWTPAYLLLRGDHLDEVWRETETGLHFVRKTKSRDYVDRLVSQQQFIACMRGQTVSFTTFNDNHFDEAEFEGQLTSDRLAIVACWYWILKLQARFIAGDYDSAIAAAEKAKLLLWVATGCFQLLEYHYYSALTIAAVFGAASPSKQREWSQALTEHVNQLREWADGYPPSFLDKYALVAAEVARIECRDLEAMRLYEQAIQSARQNGFIQNESIANEVVGKFYLDRGFDSTGHAHLRVARSCYLSWGVAGKLKQLDQLYPGLQQQAPRGPLTPKGSPIELLDLSAVVKAQHSVSREIELAKLIDTLMVIAVGNAGAERGLLFLVRGQEYTIAAEAVTGGTNVEVTQRQEFLTSPLFPESVLRYVTRTTESVVLDDASVENLFSEDEYVRATRVRSILCLPLVKQGELIGVLYLENNLTSHAFTRERIAVLELLASQAAISVENARLYADLRQENSSRRRSEAALQASEERWRSVFDSSTLAIVMIDEDLHYIAVNAAFKSMLGYTEEELRQLTPMDISIEDERDPTRQRLTCLQEGKLRHQDIETQYRRKDGSLIWVHDYASAIRAEGAKSRIIEIIIDVTESRQAQDALRATQSELARVARLTTMGELAASIAHEINQPLGAIVTSGNAGMRWLAAPIPDLGEAKAALKRIVSDGHRASQVIASLRAMFRKDGASPVRVDLNDLIREVLTLLRGELQRQQVSVVTALADSIPVVSAHRVQMQQVILNLVMNAIEATGPAADRRRVVKIVSKIQHSRDISITIEDSGPGIAPENIERVFDRFFTTKPHGMGMGLAICRSIVEAHDGRLWAEPGDFQGAVFRILLPISNASMDHEA